MPIHWTHYIVVRPRERLAAELADIAGDLDEAPTFAATHVWKFRSAGDHDYAGQHTNSISWVKLVFLANLHATARSAESHRIAESRAAATVIDGQRLDEEFFDARWTVDDVGRSCVDTGVLSQHLDAEDLNAVAGSDAPAGHRGSLGTEWADFAGRRDSRSAERDA